MTDREALIDIATKAAIAHFHEVDFGCVVSAAMALQTDLRNLDALDVENEADSTLEIVHHLGQAFETEDAERAVTALGTVIAYAAIHAAIFGMSIVPIIELGRAFCGRGDALAAHGAGRLAGVARMLEPTSEQVVEALAMCISKAIDDCEVIHNLKVDPQGVFLTVGREMIAAARVAVPVDLMSPGFNQIWDEEMVAIRERQDYEDAALATGMFCARADEVRAKIARLEDETDEAFEARCDRIMAYHPKVGPVTGLS